MTGHGVHDVAVIGAGVSGLSTALALLDAADDGNPATGSVRVSVYESGDRIGGRIDASPFAGLPHIDAGADAFLARVPEAVALATRVGLGDQLVSPEPVGAAVWHDGLHPIPDGLMLGVPGKLWPMATTGLLSWRGKLRAAAEPLLPRTSTASDSIGDVVRARFGDEVHERLVDSLVGSIYAADTDRFSLAEVPQLATLVGGNRSVLVAARRQRRAADALPATATATSGPVFAAPRDGIAAFVTAIATAVTDAGGVIRSQAPIERLDRVDAGGRTRWVVDGDIHDAVILATPAHAAAAMLVDVAGPAAESLATAETADVIMVTLHVAADEWPDRLRGLSGYLVPKPDQRRVTAASFGSQKWAHWRPPGGGEILRVSLGRDGMPVLQLSDDDAVEAVLADLRHHLGIDISPLEVRVTRWPAAFAQYRPHHAAWVDHVERSLPAGLFVTGAGYRGIGIPACVRSAAATAGRASDLLRDLAD